MRPQAKARAGATAVATAHTPEFDADRLIASFRLRAYSEARRRQRQAGAADDDAHWGAVASLIARRAGERPDEENSSTRIEFDATVAHGREALGARAPIRFFEVDPLDEVERDSRPETTTLPAAVLRRRPSIMAPPFSPKPKLKPLTPPAQSAKPPSQTGRRALSACACSISRGGRSSSGSRPISDSARLPCPEARQPRRQCEGVDQSQLPSRVRSPWGHGHNQRANSPQAKANKRQ